MQEAIGIVRPGYQLRSQRLEGGSLIAAALGFLLIFVAPYGNGYFRDWLIPISSSYRISVFELFAVPMVYGGIIHYGVRVLRAERALYAGLAMTIIVRCCSLLAAEEIQSVQFLSVLRYVESAGLIYVSSRLVSWSDHRNWLLAGIVAGVAVESVGGLLVYWATEYKGVFISNTSTTLQVFVIVASMIRFVGGRASGKEVATILLVGCSVVATLSRAPWLFFSVVVLLSMATVMSRRRMLRMVWVVLLIVGTGVTLTRLLPAEAERIGARVGSLFIQNDGSRLYRLYLWDMSLGAFLQHPVLGVGSGGFARQQQRLPEVFNIRLPEAYRELDLNLSNHSTVFNVLAETGIVGLAAYLLWAIGVLQICRIAIRSARISPAMNSYTLAASLVVLTTLMFDPVAQGSFTAVPSVLLGFVLGSLRSVHMATSSEVMRFEAEPLQGSQQRRVIAS